MLSIFAREDDFGVWYLGIFVNGSDAYTGSHCMIYYDIWLGPWLGQWTT